MIAGSTLSTVNELIDPISHSWNLKVLKGSLHHSDAYEALKFPLCWSNTEDKLIWPHTKEGTYTVKSGYWCMKENLTYANDIPTSSYSHSKESC